MIESPLIKEVFAEELAKAAAEAESKARHEAIIEVLSTRFGEIPTDLQDRIRSVQDKKILSQMTRDAAACKDLDTFQGEGKVSGTVSPSNIAVHRQPSGN
jgi:hypothetical protein